VHKKRARERHGKARDDRKSFAFRPEQNNHEARRSDYFEKFSEPMPEARPCGMPLAVPLQRKNESARTACCLTV